MSGYVSSCHHMGSDSMKYLISVRKDMLQNIIWVTGIMMTFTVFPVVPVVKRETVVMTIPKV